MKKIKVFIAIGFCVSALYSCNDDEKFSTDHERKTAVFTSSVGGENFTRAYDTFWSADDQIGVFMKSAGQELNSASILSNAFNISYITKDKVTFRAFNESEAIYYPDDGSMVDFIAYYPYQSGLTGYTYKVDVSDQTSQEAIDLLYSDNATDQTNVSHHSNLIFSHQLTKIKFMVEAGEGISNLNGLEVSISGVKATADFNLATGAITATGLSDHTISFKVSGDDAEERIAEAILVPDQGETERVVTFTLPSGKTFRHIIETGFKLEKNTRYTFPARLEDNSAVVGPQTGYVETPLMADLPATWQYVVHMMPDRPGRNFAMLYDNQYRIAYWVAYPLVPSDHVGDSGRTEAWDYDPLINVFFQPDLSSGFPAANTDRGHQVPSADRTCSKPVNRMTFYYSNMTAQNSQLNQGMWASLENKIRSWASECDTMYVVTGAMIQTATDNQIEYVYDNSNSQVARPKYYFKALAKRTGNSYTTIAFLINNEKPVVGDNYNNHRQTVKSLEAETGFTFFPSLSDNVKGNIEPSKWN